ncbi:TetR/AcrR family transcriptional regulator [soil metagenome]
MDDTRQRIVAAAAAILAEKGRDCVTTRAVSAKAGVQDPAIYRLFGDKRGLLDAVTVYGFEQYMKDKAALPVTDDPVENLRAGWDLHIQFGLANPALYSLIYGDPRPGATSPAAEVAIAVLHQHIHDIAAAGLLSISEERAAQLVHAAGSGTTLALLAQPESQRDMAASTLAREAVIAAITTDKKARETSDVTVAAIALRANLTETSALTTTESALMRDWLDRVIAENHHRKDSR